MDNDTNTAVLDAPTTPAASEPSVYAQSEWDKQTPAERTAHVQKIGEAMEAKDTARREAEQTPLAAEKTKTPETPVASEEIPADDDAVKTADEVGGEDEFESWIDDSVKDFVDAMGLKLSDEELASFSSREELDRALRIIDRKAFEEAGKPAESSSPAKEKPAAPAPVESANDPFADLAKFKLKAATDDETGFDPEAIKPLNEFVDATAAAVKRLEAKLASYEQAQQQTAVQNLRTKAIESLHALGHKDLFGEPGKALTKEQSANIEKALDAHVTHARGVLSRGGKPVPSTEFLRSAVNLAFGDQIVSAEKRRQADKIRKSAARRTGGGTPKHDAPQEGQKPGESEYQYLKRIEPDVSAIAQRVAAKAAERLNHPKQQ